MQMIKVPNHPERPNLNLGHTQTHTHILYLRTCLDEQLARERASASEGEKCHYATAREVISARNYENEIARLGLRSRE